MEENQLVEISDLPDYPFIKKLAESLYKYKENEKRGSAAIMIGAGFSRSAATANEPNKKMPLWNDLSKIIKKQIGSDISNDLQLAQEYDVYFGTAELYKLIRKEINDDIWTPGKLYGDLLKLPWSDILTTNWDTLLERASKKLFITKSFQKDNKEKSRIYNYNLVYKQEDISYLPQPRIVKLHGTIGITKDLIFTDENYRQYPKIYPIFINFVREIFIENEVCLLGFSGSDPNFLQWIGWVRDQLGSHARRIYFVNFSKLSDVKRKYLESLNIIPIDLSNLFSNEYENKYEKTIEKFLKELNDLKETFLSTEKINEWTPKYLQEDELKNLEKMVSFFENDRKSYPNWLICPINIREDFKSQIYDAISWQLKNKKCNENEKLKQNIISNERQKLLYEVAWRYNLIYEPMPKELIEELLTLLDNNQNNNKQLNNYQKIEISLWIFKNTHWIEDSNLKLEINKIITPILEINKKIYTSIKNELICYQAMIMLYECNYQELEKIVNEIPEDEPVFKLRKAGFLDELAYNKESEILIEDAYLELLQQYQNNRDSIYIGLTQTITR